MVSESSRRERLLRHVRRMLRSRSSPRWHMSLVVLATGAWGRCFCGSKAGPCIGAGRGLGSAYILQPLSL